MSASQASASTAIAFQLIGALEAYEADVAQLAAQCVDPRLYDRLRLRLDEMRGYAATLPDLSVHWVELLIRHFELAHALWKRQQGGQPQDSVAALQDSHRACVERLRAHCVRILQHEGAPSPS